MISGIFLRQRVLPTAYDVDGLGALRAQGLEGLRGLGILGSGFSGLVPKLNP